jgi:predicted SAM-dependent methyltransferase
MRAGIARMPGFLARLRPELRAIRYLKHRVVGLWFLRRRIVRGKVPLRLHVGSGDRRLPDWINLDLKPYPGVDLAADVRHGLPFRNVSLIFAEHFLEHLDLLTGVEFLLESHRVLIPAGKIRLSTPSLDWVWQTHPPGSDSIEGALAANRAFYGWGHRFLWNRALLEQALEACGFTGIQWLSYGESEDPSLRGLERHETYGDRPGTPHILVVEAAKGASQEGRLRELRAALCKGFVFHLPG